MHTHLKLEKSPFTKGGLKIKPKTDVGEKINNI